MLRQKQDFMAPGYSLGPGLLGLLRTGFCSWITTSLRPFCMHFDCISLVALWSNMLPPKRLMCNWGEHIFFSSQIFGDLRGSAIIHQRGQRSLDSQIQFH